MDRSGDMDCDGIAGRKFIFAYNMDKITDMRFRIGQEIVCIKRGAWISSVTGEPYTDGRPNPKFNDIVIVDGYNDSQYIYLIRYDHICGNGKRQSFKEDRFAPILENLDEIKEVLNETIEI